jgi:phospholipase C
LPFPPAKQFLESIHKAQFKRPPSDYRKLSTADVAEFHRDRFSAGWMPRQEPGVRHSTALPYELYAAGRLSADGKHFELELEARNEIFGKRSAGSGFHVYTVGKFRNRSDLRTRAYTVSAGGRLTDTWEMAGFDSRSYDLHVCGPNGFYRGFAGSAADPALEVSCEYVREGRALTGDVAVRMVNRGGQVHTIHISDQAYGGGTHKVTLPPGATRSFSLALAHSYHWYDFSVSVAGAPGFLRRYAGRVETGRDGFSDPAMGRVSD